MRRIEVKPKGSLRDPKSYLLQKEIREMFKIDINDLMITKGYSIEGELSDEDLDKLGKELFADRVSEEYLFNAPAYQNVWRIEIGLLPGMTDNIGKTAESAIEDVLGKAHEVHHFRVYYIDADIEDEEILDKVADLLLANKVIERWRVYGPDDKTFEPFSAKVDLKHEPEIKKINLNVPKEELERMSKDMLLALTGEEMIGISDYYKDEGVLEARKKLGLDGRATDVELEALAQSWSEHCKHKIFNAEIDYYENGVLVEEISSIFKTYIQGATEKAMKPYVVSVFKDNGGIIKFNLDNDVAVKGGKHTMLPLHLTHMGGRLQGYLE